MASEQRMRDSILNFSLDNCPRGNQGYNRVLLQLFGLTGHGKSSFINSCKFVLDGEYKMHAEAAVVDEGLTMARIPHKLTDTVTLVDNRGLVMMETLEKGEVYAQLANFLPLNEKVEWSKGYEDFMYRLEDSEMDPNFTDILVPVFIYSVRKKIAEEEIPEVKQLFDDCKTLTGICPIFVLTYKASGDFMDVEMKVRRMGAEGVYAIENYTEKNHEKTPEQHKAFLEILKNILKGVESLMDQERNPKVERKTRKKFLLRYVHEYEKEEREKASKREERERQERERQERDRQERDRQERERQERGIQGKEKQERERQVRERQERERQERERRDQGKQERGIREIEIQERERQERKESKKSKCNLL